MCFVRLLFDAKQPIFEQNLKKMVTTVKIDIDNPMHLESVLAFIEQLGLKAKVSKNGKSKPVEMTEDDYLFSNEANKQHLLEAFDYIENGGKMISVDLDQLKKELLPND